MSNFSTGATAHIQPFTGSQFDLRAARQHLLQAKRALTIIKKSRWSKALRHWLEAGSNLPVVYRPVALLPSFLAAPLQRYIVGPTFELLITSMVGIFTNVPGPQEPVKLQGVAVTAWTVLPPSAGKDTLAIGLISYAGELTVSVMADGSDGTARRICDGYEARLKQYVDLARSV